MCKKLADIKLNDEVKELRTILRHMNRVEDYVGQISHDLLKRARNHDQSKFKDDEFKPYAYARELLPETKEVKEAKTIHSDRNSHHPEFHGKDSEMGFLDIIEMVCDWASAGIAYEDGNPLKKSVCKNLRRFDFTPEQVWLIRQVADYIYEKFPEVNDHHKFNKKSHA